jgi:hypothetical protein
MTETRKPPDWRDRDAIERDWRERSPGAYRIAKETLPDSVLLKGIHRVSVACDRGRLSAFLHIFNDGSGTSIDAGPCPCGGERAKCNLPATRHVDQEGEEIPFDRDEAIRRAEKLVAHGDSLPTVTTNVRCPEDCKEDHKHDRHGSIVVMCGSMDLALVPYARRCLAYEKAGDG